MFFSARFRRRFISPVAGVLLVLLVWSVMADLIPGNFIPPLITIAEAKVADIDPDGDGSTSDGAQTTCGGGGNFDCVDDAVRQPTAPSTSGDSLSFGRNDLDIYTMDNSLTDVATVTSIIVWMHHESGASNFNFSVALMNSSETIISGPQAMTNNSTPGWGSLTFSGLALTQGDLDGLRIQTECLRSGGGNSTCTNYELYAEVTYDPVINVTVGTTGAQVDLDTDTTNQHVGGVFTIEGTNGSRSITSITITENGTVNGLTNLDNIKLRYDLDTVFPYDCASVSYAVTDTQYGLTDSSGFSAANGSSTFTGGVTVSPTQTMCVYVELDVLSTAGATETIEIEISDPTIDVVGTGSPVIDPATAILIANTTTLQKTILTQGNYHWRNDDGNEVGASSATGGTENTTYNNFPKSSTKRLRMAVSNTGNKTSATTQYRLEFASKVTTCSVATGWTDVGATGGDFDMFDTGNLTNGNDTTDILVASGGVTNSDTFITTNGAVTDTSSQTSNITLTSTQYVEIEYAIRASSTVTDGNTYCFRVTDAGTEIGSYVTYPEATTAADITVDTSGTQTAEVSIPVTAAYAGGVFTIVDTTAGANPATSITVTAGGTVDAQNDISNITMRYDLDTVAPYDCASVSYANTDTTFGSTASAFNGSNQVTFTGSVSVSTTQTMCVYLEYDVGSNTNNGDTLELSIADPSTEVVVTSSSVAPSSPVAISGSTEFANPVTTQSNYHWRNNDGNEAGATSATGGAENTTLAEVAKNTAYRLRFGITNSGLASTSALTYRLEWAQKISTCAAVASWTRVDTAADEWEMAPIGNLTEGDDTTDIAVSTGGVSDSATNFRDDNNGVNDDTDTTSSSILPPDSYLDLEYSIRASSTAIQGATYCFQITNAGTDLDSYTNYAEAVIKLDTDFKIQRGVSTVTGTNLTITAGVEYEAPASASSSFIRITNTQLTGAGPNTGNGNGNADDVTTYISNPNNLLTSITFQRSAFAGGNTRIAWEIVEYTGVASGENEIIVRHQDILTYGTAATVVSGATVGTVATDADAVAFITSQYNPDAGRNSYDWGISTSDWNTINSQVDLTRGASGNAAIASYSLVEFTGTNWKVQRVENNYSAVGSTEIVAITAVNNLARSFLHVQKRTSQNNHADFGHEVWLSGIGQVSFLLDSAASIPGNHTSVAWVIENIQTLGKNMIVTRGNGTFSTSGTGPETNNVSIGKTLDDLTVTSLFVNNRSDESQRSWPEPIMSARLISTTQYELWRSDASSNTNFRTEIVEWPTAARKLEQNDYRLYVDNDALLPTDPWPVGGANLSENAEMTAGDGPMANSDTVRIRMTLSVTASAMPAGLDSFKLEFGKRITTCTAISQWLELGEIGSTTAVWRGVDNTPVDGTALSTDPPGGGDLLILVATVAGTYEEQNNSVVNPFTAFPGDEVEYDWVVQHNGADDKSSYCFRMLEANDTLFEVYNAYPVLRTVGYDPQLTNWRWYDDETNITPSTDMALENVMPNGVVDQNAVKLRLVLVENSGAVGTDTKFILQFSEYADFSQSVATVTATSSCVNDSLWCYYDGAGVDNVQIVATAISDADLCGAGGCGTHNEGTSTVDATFDQGAFESTEYEFTLLQAGARANTVYYFRLYDTVNNELVPLAGGATYPSIMAEGAQLVFTVAGLPSGTNTAGITTDSATTPTAIGFGSLPFGSSVEAAQRITIDTNATEGYQLLKYAPQQLLNFYAEPIAAITATNAVPAGWTTACMGGAVGCFGYHTTDASLDGGSTRFAPVDSYAALDTSPQEIMYSSIPTTDVHDLIYRVQVTQEQPTGDYQTNIVYLAIPVF